MHLRDCSFYSRSDFSVLLFRYMSERTLPAPNEYHIPNVLGSSKEGPIRSAPAYTITGRQKQTLPECIGFPGPGHYDAKIDPLVRRAPMFSMATRFRRPTDEALKPGPAAHYPEKINLGHVPAYSFGIKHSEYLGDFPEPPRYRNQLVI
ncbi:outer dense fiber protein 3-like [Anopheles moucheti]|uniref:outer dense fiber protein 3-like n=1 Tax=Anopheles moucheti TaxID=186751 RepID=UPI0022F0FDD9|nr:outer dense fiber protein 3-like [Anopheles moucheti]